MKVTTMSPDKSQLLAYLKHTPGFENKVWEFANLSTEEILSNVRDQDLDAYQTCVERFRERGVHLAAA